ncbi:MAG: hypothetical protein LW629_09595 [Burkholderiales bacterium]|nr:hypothetical protein [Burkholderiales bacterium]
MSLVSRLTVKLADRRWKTSLAAGFAAALIWYLLLQKLSKGETVATPVVSGLVVNPLLPACGIFLLSALTFHLLRPVTTKNISPVAEKNPQHSTLSLNIQLLIGLYDENIFSARDLSLYSLPEVLLRTACTDVKLLANEQADALLTAQRFHKTQLHLRQCDTADVQQHLLLLKNTLGDIRMQSQTAEIYLFQGVLETTDEKGGELLIPWAFTLQPEQDDSEQTESISTKTLQSLEMKVRAHLQEGLDGNHDPLFSLPLLIVNWLK